MSDASFEVWMSHSDADEFQSVLRGHGLTISATRPLQQRSGVSLDAVTVIIFVSGAINSIAKAFTAYFQSREKCIKVSNLETSFYVKNYTPSEVAKIAKAGNHIILTNKPKDSKPDEAQLRDADSMGGVNEHR